MQCGVLQVYERSLYKVRRSNAGAQARRVSGGRRGWGAGGAQQRWRRLQGQGLGHPPTKGVRHVRCRRGAGRFALCPDPAPRACAQGITPASPIASCAASGLGWADLWRPAARVTQHEACETLDPTAAPGHTSTPTGACGRRCPSARPRATACWTRAW